MSYSNFQLHLLKVLCPQDPNQTHTHTQNTDILRDSLKSGTPWRNRSNSLIKQRQALQGVLSQLTTLSLSLHCYPHRSLTLRCRTKPKGLPFYRPNITPNARPPLQCKGAQLLLLVAEAAKTVKIGAD